MTEIEELQHDLQATIGELFPGRAHVTPSENVIALGVLLRRELRATPYRPVNLSTRILDRLAKYDPKDPE